MPRPSLSATRTLALSTLTALGACTGVLETAPSGDPVGIVALDLTGAPPNTKCVQIAITQGTTTTTRSFDLRPEVPATFVLKGLPTGSVTLRERAFTQACAAVTATTAPLLISDPVTVTLLAGTPTDVTFNLATPDAGAVITAHTSFPTPSGTITLFGGSLPSTGPITVGSDGNLWLVGGIQGSVVRVTPAGTISSFFPPGPIVPLSRIAAAPDGTLWTTQSQPDEEFVSQIPLGRFFTSGVGETRSSFPFQPTLLYPSGIVAGPDGNMWFAASGVIVRASLNGNDAFLPVPATPNELTVGSDGNIWFTEFSSVDILDPSTTEDQQPLGTSIGRVTPAGVVTEFALPGGVTALGIAAGSDGGIWITERDSNRIVHFRPPGSAVTTLPALTTVAATSPTFIAAGPDGNLWVGHTTAVISRVTTAGAVQDFAFDDNAGGVGGITAGPDGNVWFTRNPGATASVFHGMVGRIVP